MHSFYQSLKGYKLNVKYQKLQLQSTTNRFQFSIYISMFYYITKLFSNDMVILSNETAKNYFLKK